jgi:integrase
MPGGVFERITWIDGRKSVASLRTRSRTEARARAEAFLRALLKQGDQPRYAPPTLGEIWDRYRQEAASYRRNTPKTRAEKKARAELLLLGLGRGKRAEHLTLNDIGLYAELRRSGKGWSDGRETEAVGDRSVAADLQLLRHLLRWATTVRNGDGSWFLTEYPLRGLELPSETSPRRPIVTFERYVALRTAIQGLALRASNYVERCKWIRLEMALVLAEGTGRRIGSIRQLRWSDVDFDAGVIYWRKAADKKRRAWRVPSPTVVGELAEFRRALRVIGDGWLFPQERKDAPDSTDVLSQRLLQAEEEAKLPKIDGGVWHPYRRKWRTERKHLPDRDVMDAGGWADERTMRESYEQSDDGTLVSVMECPTKLMHGKLTALG